MPGPLVLLALAVAARVVVSKPVALVLMGFTPFVTLGLPEKLHLNVERRGHPFACGLICSALNLTAGVSGPILDIFFVRSRMGRHEVVATKAMTQSFSHLLKIAYFGGIVATGRGTVDPWIGGMMVILAFTGTSLAAPVLKRMNDRSFRQWTR